MTTLEELLDREMEQELYTEPMVLNLGPSHPVTHGTVRVILTLDGETVLHCDPEIGYLHRGFEKETENCTYSQVFPYTDRLNYVSPLLNNFGYAMTVEKLLGVQVPPRCNYIRVIMGELSRLGDHLTSIGAGSMELAGFTPFLYAVEGRELTWDLIEEVSGARLTTSYARIGGLAHDLTPGFADHWKAIRPHLLKIHRDIDKLLTRNRIFLDRMEGTGVISADKAIAHGFTGPCLRSTGVDYDVRKDHPYFAYGDLEFEVPVGTRGDNYDRYLVRMEEILQSIRIIDQALAQIPDGPYKVDDYRIILPDKNQVYDTIEGMMAHFKVVFEGVHVPAGEVYGYTEGANGELGFYLVSDGSGQPWRLHVRPPAFYLMSAFSRMIEGGMIADIIPTFDSINYIAGEVDR
ncbi:MAG: NADH-quinone oxidoreductase subunit D [Bradymonadales bacterium]|nr:NADH-quinone oxidoreductase subunit D [Bradymonadales bacterium]